MNTMDYSNHNQWTKLAIVTGVYSVCFGILYNITQRIAFGINMPISLVLFYATLFICLKPKLTFKNTWLFVLVFLNSLSFALFNNGLILFFNFVSLFVLLAINVTQLMGVSTNFVCICATLFVRPFHRIGGLFQILFPKERKKSSMFLAILFGTLIALPIIIILLLLFAQSDMIFNSLLQSVAQAISFWNVIGFLITFFVIYMFVASFFISLKSVPMQQTAKQKPLGSFPTAPTAVVLILINFVLAVFCMIQLIYLTGVSPLPQGYTYSDYARTGFFQLCVASAIVFAVISFCVAYTRQGSGRAKKVINVLATLMCCFTLLLLISAFYRMALYEQEYLFTQLRVYVQAFIILLFIITLLTLVKIWKDHLKILSTVFYTTCIMLIGLTYFNVDAFIAQQNTKEVNSNKTDIDYLLTLSADALPYYAHLLSIDGFIQYNMNDVNGVDEEFYRSENSPRLTGRGYLLLSQVDFINSLSGDYRWLNVGRYNAALALNEISDIIEYCRATSNW